MANPKLSPLELQVMESLWSEGQRSVREIQESFPEKDRPAYTTVQTMLYRLERKKAVRRVKRISNAHIFEAVITRDAAQGRFVDELLRMFGWRMQPLMAHLIESGKLTLKDVKEAEETLQKLAKKGSPMSDALINHLWQSTLCALAAGLLTLAFQKNGARVRFYIWLAASVKFLIPFSLVVWIGTFFRWQAEPALPTAGGFSSLMDQIAQPATALTTNLAAMPVASAALDATWSGWAIVLSIWLSGRYRPALPPRVPVALSARRSENLNTTRSRRPDPRARDREHAGAGLFGIFRPVLLLPAGIATQLSPEQLDAIVAHELCHWRRRDNLTAALHMLVEALFWFHPLVWWLGGKLIEERERACDESVLQSGGDRHAYAEGILKICQRYVEPPVCRCRRVRWNSQKAHRGNHDPSDPGQAALGEEVRSGRCGIRCDCGAAGSRRNEQSRRCDRSWRDDDEALPERAVEVRAGGAEAVGGNAARAHQQPE